MDIDELKILLGNSIEPPEVDMDAKQENGDYPYQLSALQSYYFSVFVNSIGKEDFKTNYLIIKNTIKEYSTKDQLKLTIFILDKINNIYDFEFPKYLYPDNQEDINQLYEFLEFLEYNHEDFIKEIWYYLDTDNKIDIDKICKEQSDKIMLEIEEQLESQYYSELSSYFLRTYIKENMIKWFCEKSKILKTMVLLTTRKGEMENE